MNWPSPTSWPSHRFLKVCQVLIILPQPLANTRLIWDGELAVADILGNLAITQILKSESGTNKYQIATALGNLMMREMNSDDFAKSTRWVRRATSSGNIANS